MTLTRADILVSWHAAERWRERAAAYGDAPAEDLRAAVRASRLVPLREALGLVPGPLHGSSPGRPRAYAVHPSGAVLFALAPEGPRAFRVVTVLLTSEAS